MKKKSLLAATAMLLIAVIAATGATFAWFTSISQATSTFNMGVATGASLEISTDTGDSKTWGNSATIAPAGAVWQDLSTPGNAATFIAADLENNTSGSASSVNAYKEGTAFKVTIYFRSNTSEDVTFDANTLVKAATGGTAHATLLSAARILVVDVNASNKVTIYGNGDARTSKAVIDTDGTDGTYNVVSYTATTPVVVTMEDTVTNADGYYHGQADFYFFIEGTLAFNEHLIGLSAEGLTTDLFFKQIKAGE